MEFARAAAQHFGNPLIEYYVTPKDIVDLIDILPVAYDEPFANTSVVPAYYCAKLARDNGISLMLAGDGGDELFGGYPSFTEVPRLVNAFSKVPGMRCAGRAFRLVAAPLLSRVTSPKYASLFEYGSTYSYAYMLRRALFLPWELPELMGDADAARDGWRQLEAESGLRRQVEALPTPRAKISALETSLYMRSQLLRDSDWAGMAHSLEIRVPLVDTFFFRRIVGALASPAPPGKRDMAATPAKPLPDAVLNRPKTGFAVPMREWLLPRLVAQDRGGLLCLSGPARRSAC